MATSNTNDLKLGYDILYLISCHLPDRTRLQLCMTNKTLYSMGYSMLLRDHVQRALKEHINDFASDTGNSSVSSSHDDEEHDALNEDEQEEDDDEFEFDESSIEYGMEGKVAMIPRVLSFTIEKDNVAFARRLMALIDFEDCKLIRDHLRHFWIDLISICVTWSALACFEFFAEETILISSVNHREASTGWLEVIAEEKDISMLDSLTRSVLFLINSDEVDAPSFSHTSAIAQSVTMIETILNLAVTYIPDPLAYYIMSQALVAHCGVFGSPSTIVNVLLKFWGPDPPMSFLKPGFVAACKHLNVEAMKTLLELGDPRWPQMLEDFDPWKTVLDQMVWDPLSGGSDYNHPKPWIWRLYDTRRGTNNGTERASEIATSSPSHTEPCQFCVDNLLPHHRGSYWAWLDQIQLFGKRLLACITFLLAAGAGVSMSNESGESSSLETFFKLSETIIVHSRSHRFGRNVTPESMWQYTERLAEEAEEFQVFGDICDEFLNAGAHLLDLQAMPLETGYLRLIRLLRKWQHS